MESNLTENSFSDGGLYLAPRDALAHARRLRLEGADIVELGPASCHPDAVRVAADEERAAGVEQERLVIDPGLGYFVGSNPEPSFAVMAGLHRLKTRFGAAVLVSPSRKSFLRNITSRGLPDIGAASLAAELYAASQGVDYIRTHDVAALRDALTVHAAIISGQADRRLTENGGSRSAARSQRSRW